MAKLALRVPDGQYCWNPMATSSYTEICQFFDNEGGNARCTIFRVSLEEGKKGKYLRPKCCVDKLLSI